MLCSKRVSFIPQALTGNPSNRVGEMTMKKVNAPILAGLLFVSLVNVLVTRIRRPIVGSGTTRQTAIEQETVEVSAQPRKNTCRSSPARCLLPPEGTTIKRSVRGTRGRGPRVCKPHCVRAENRHSGRFATPLSRVGVALCRGCKEGRSNR